MKKFNKIYFDTVYVDVDGVCADLIPEWLRLYNLDFEDNLKPWEIKDWAIENYVKPEAREEIKQYLKNPNLYNLVSPILGAKESVLEMRDIGLRVVFATVSPMETPYRKFYWLRQHGFKPTIDNYIELQDKSLLAGDNCILIDDGFANVMKFRGVGFLYTAFHNESFKWENRVSDWADFMNIVRECCRV